MEPFAFGAANAVSRPEPRSRSSCRCKRRRKMPRLTIPLFKFLTCKSPHCKTPENLPAANSNCSLTVCTLWSDHYPSGRGPGSIASKSAPRRTKECQSQRAIAGNF
jgi:hypothetical protein